MLGQSSGTQIDGEKTKRYNPLKPSCTQDILHAQLSDFYFGYVKAAE